MDRAKPFVWRLVAASVCLLTFCHLARADSLEEQRNRYAQIKQAWDNRQMDVVEQMMPGLKDYPLYPYLEYRKITDDLMNQPRLLSRSLCAPILRFRLRVRCNHASSMSWRVVKTGAACWRLARRNRHHGSAM
ncbi:lytic murein transglycosylase [Salmonella enterica subsp. enterica]|uniref:Lytic murein transglycosylase n=1 Tax=Salmonella enterica I TaxID=59201 RepID=A0A379V0U8_SALET|nr:lytic murein transglycosylase [Salmonella enterica subsp. enterica]